MEKKTRTKEPDQFDFEKALARLENIVKELESSEPPLNKALSLFQEAKKLSALCDKELGRFEQKVQKILEDEKGNISLEDFAPREEENSPPEKEEEEEDF